MVNLKLNGGIETIVFMQDKIFCFFDMLSFAIQLE